MPLTGNRTPLETYSFCLTTTVYNGTMSRWKMKNNNVFTVFNSSCLSSESWMYTKLEQFDRPPMVTNSRFRDKRNCLPAKSIGVVLNIWQAFAMHVFELCFGNERPTNELTVILCHEWRRRHEFKWTIIMTRKATRHHPRDQYLALWCCTWLLLWSLFAFSGSRPRLEVACLLSWPETKGEESSGAIGYSSMIHWSNRLHGTRLFVAPARSRASNAIRA